MRTIHDPAFLKKFLFEFCHRGVHGAENTRAIEQRHIEIDDLWGARLSIRICDSQGRLIEVGWDGIDEAWPIYYMPIDGFLGKCDRWALSRCIEKFLRKHGAIDREGAVIKRGAA